MFSHGDHIRCCATCRPADDANLAKLVLANCGRCLFHRGCLPDNCKCGLPAHPAAVVGKKGCFVQGCSAKPASWFVLCPEHGNRVVEKTIARIQLMGELHHTALVSYLSYFPGLPMAGDVLQLVTEQVIRALQQNWRIVCTADRRYVFFTTFVAQIAKGVAFHPQTMVTELDLPSEAVAELTRCGKSQLNGWVMQPNGLLRHSDKKAAHTPTCAAELYRFLTSASRPTYPTAQAIAMYPDAPQDIMDMVSDGKLVYLEHFKFVAARPKAHTANRKLRDYWMEHIAPGLISVLSGDGAT